MLTAKLYVADEGATGADPSGRRAERRTVQVGATLRDDQSGPLDAEVVNLSTSGCLLRVAADLQVPSNVTIGIAGIGRVPAWIMRREGDSYGCYFLYPLSDAAVAEARAVETVVPFAAPTEAVLPPAPVAETVFMAAPDRAPRLSYRARLAVIVLLALAAWVAVAALAWGLAAALR